MPSLMSARTVRHTLWLAVAVAVVWLPVATPAQEKKGPSTEDILKSLLGGGGEPQIQTRGIGRVKAQPRADQPAAAASGGRIAVPIQFRYNSAEITSESFDQLGSVAEALSDPRLQATRILVEGHTDSQGSDAYNQWLSERRAEAVRRFLVEKGHVPASRLDSRGYGKSRPLPAVSQDTEEGRALNRRVELVNLGRDRIAEAGRPRDARPTVAVQPDLQVSVAVIYKRAGETRTLAAGGELTPNDHYRVTFTPSENSYVYVYRIDAKGKALRIFPNAESVKATNPVTAQHAYNIPPEGQWFGLDQEPGDEEIVVVAARNELPDATAIAIRRRGQGLTILTRGPAADARADVAPELPPGVFSYRLPFKHR